MLCSLEDLKNEDVRSDAQIIGNVVDGELQRTLLRGNVKIKFLCEQLLLVVKTSNGRRYSQDVLALACMWQNVSPALYKQIQADAVLTLPNYKYVRRLSSALTVDLRLSDSTIVP